MEYPLEAFGIGRHVDLGALVDNHFVLESRCLRRNRLGNERGNREHLYLLACHPIHRARFELRAALAGALGTDTLTSSTAHYAWLTAPLDGCAHALSGRAVRLAGCVRVEPGYLRVQFADIAHSLPWLAVGAGARLGWNAGPIRLEIEGFADLPVSGYRITREGTTFVPFRAAAGAFAAGFMVPFS